MTRASSSHSPSCAASRSCMRLAPTEKLSRSPEMTKAEKSRTESEEGWRTEEISDRTSPPIAFLSEWSSMHATPSPKSMREAPELERMTPLDRRKSATRAWPEMGWIGSQPSFRGLKDCGPTDRYQVTELGSPAMSFST